jgi:hypothetical protein
MKMTGFEQLCTFASPGRLWDGGEWESVRTEEGAGQIHTSRRVVAPPHHDHLRAS